MAIKVEVVNITPEIAEEMLTHNINNRHLNPGLADKYAADMKNGDWQLNGETIVFSEDGVLMDGQHRLHGIIRAGVAVPMTVVRGVDRNVKLFNCGRKRNTRDIMSIYGYIPELRNSCTIGAVNFLINNYADLGRKATAATIMTFTDEYAELLTKSREAVLCGKNHPISVKASLCAAAFCALFSGISYNRVCRFFEVVNTGFMADANESPAIILRNFILSPAKYEKLFNVGHGGGYFQSRLFDVCIRGISDFSVRPRTKFYSNRDKTELEMYMKSNAFTILKSEAAK